MKRKLNILTILYLFFLVLLFLSGSINGILGEIVYYLAFILPLGVGVYLSRGEYFDAGFKMNKEKLRFTLPLIMPTVAVVIVLAALTSFWIYVMTGRTNSVDLGDSFVLAIISHALVPAVLEELLFRYLPIRFLSGRSERAAVFASAFLFALIHHDLFSIPYAFVAGIVFMAIDLATGSIIPSILIHFINNALSVGIIIYGDNPAFVPTMYSIIAIMTVISIIFIIKRRRDYLDAAEFIFQRDGEPIITPEMMLFAGITLTVAVAILL